MQPVNKPCSAFIAGSTVDQNDALVYWNNRKIRAMQASHIASVAIVGGGVISAAYFGTALSYGTLAVPQIALFALACAVVGVVFKVFSILDRREAEKQIHQWSSCPPQGEKPHSKKDCNVSVESFFQRYSSSLPLSEEAIVTFFKDNPLQDPSSRTVKNRLTEFFDATKESFDEVMQSKMPLPLIAASQIERLENCYRSLCQENVEAKDQVFATCQSQLSSTRLARRDALLKKTSITTEITRTGTNEQLERDLNEIQEVLAALRKKNDSILSSIEVIHREFERNSGILQKHFEMSMTWIVEKCSMDNGSIAMLFSKHILYMSALCTRSKSEAIPAIGTEKMMRLSFHTVLPDTIYDAIAIC